MPEEVHFFGVLMRWLHITGAVVAAGGTIFGLLVMLPALRGLEPDVRSDIMESVRKRFSLLFMAGIAALVASGFYNYIAVEIPQHQGQGLYHGLMGAKIALAMVVFFIGSALVGRSKAFEGLRRKRRRWMRRNVTLLLIILVLAAILRSMPEVTAG
jgi:uncharacterized membrane protein